MRQNFVPESQVKGQLIADSPIVKPINRVVVVHPVLTSQEFQLLEGVSITEQHIKNSVFGERAIVKCKCPVGICLQLLVLYSMQPAETKFELVPATRPRHIIAGFIAEVRVLPRIVAWVPGDAEWLTCKRDSWQPSLPVVG